MKITGNISTTIYMFKSFFFKSRIIFYFIFQLQLEYLFWSSTQSRNRILSFIHRYILGIQRKLTFLIYSNPCSELRQALVGRQLRAQRVTKKSGIKRRIRGTQFLSFLQVHFDIMYNYIMYKYIFNYIMLKYTITKNQIFNAHALFSFSSSNNKVNKRTSSSEQDT